MFCRDLEGFTGPVEIGSITMGRVYNSSPTGEHVMGKMDTNVKDSLDHIRAATQELHGAISDAVAKRGGATKADLEAFAQKAKAATESAKGSPARGRKESSCGRRHSSRSDAEAHHRESEEFRPSIPDLGPESPRRRACFRSEGQRSRCCKAFGYIHKKPQIGEFHAQLHPL